jgi:hypothetical protein
MRLGLIRVRATAWARRILAGKARHRATEIDTE